MGQIFKTFVSLQLCDIDMRSKEDAKLGCLYAISSHFYMDNDRSYSTVVKVIYLGEGKLQYTLGRLSPELTQLYCFITFSFRYHSSVSHTPLFVLY